MSLRTKVSASLSAVPKEPSGSCGVMATRRPPWAGTAPITLLVKAGVPAPARAAAMKVEAFINTPSWPFGNYLLQPNFLVVRGVTSVARRVLAQRSHEIGRASCRERVCQSGEILVAAGSTKKKKK